MEVSQVSHILHTLHTSLVHRQHIVGGQGTPWEREDLEGDKRRWEQWREGGRVGEGG